MAATAQPGRLRAFLADHWIITSVLVVAAFVRVVVMLAYPPALFSPDSLAYVASAVHLSPDLVRPAGYSFFLRLLLPYRSFTVVTGVQALMGLVMGVEVYAVLRRMKLPAWAGALAALPVLFAAIELQLEHYVLSDTLFALLVTTSVLAVVWTDKPRLWVLVPVGLMLAWAVIDRSQGELLIIPFVLFLIVVRLRLWKLLVGAVVLVAMFIAPLAAYELWFDQHHGADELTSSTGAFMYSRVATFVNCSVVKPPASERWLCPTQPLGQRNSEDWYMWSTTSPLKKAPGGPFSNETSKIGTNFAIRTIKAQPLAYLGTVWSASIEAFLPYGDTNKSAATFAFPAKAPALKPPYTENSMYDRGKVPNAATNEPYARWLLDYQHAINLPGPLLGLIALVGLAGGILGWRRYGRQALLAWVSGLVLIIVPAGTADYHARYVVAAVPVLCIAGALGVREVYAALRRRRGAPTTAAAAPVTGPAAG